MVKERFLPFYRDLKLQTDRRKDRYHSTFYFINSCFINLGSSAGHSKMILVTLISFLEMIITRKLEHLIVSCTRSTISNNILIIYLIFLSFFYFILERFRLFWLRSSIWTFWLVSIILSVRPRVSVTRSLWLISNIMSVRFISCLWWTLSITS